MEAGGDQCVAFSADRAGDVVDAGVRAQGAGEAGCPHAGDREWGGLLGGFVADDPVGGELFPGGGVAGAAEFHGCTTVFAQVFA